MRLLATNDQSQISFAEAILAVGEARSHPEAIVIEEPAANTQVIAMPHQNFIVDSGDDVSRMQALHWLFPSGNPSDYPSSCVLAITNKSVDRWNALIQGKHINFINFNWQICISSNVGFVGHCRSTQPNPIRRRKYLREKADISRRVHGRRRPPWTP